jgi:hypothetical protein
MRFILLISKLYEKSLIMYSYDAFLNMFTVYDLEDDLI